MDNDNNNNNPTSEQNEIWTRSFISVALINLTTFISFHMTTSGLPLFLSQLGAPAMIAGLATTIVTISAVLARPLTEIISGRFGRKSILILGVALMTLSIVSYAAFPFIGIILFMRAVHGIGWGLGTTLTFTLASDIVPKKRFAEGIGYFSLTASLANAIAPALAIALLQNVGILPMVIVASCSSAISLTFAILLKPQKKPVQKEKKKISFSDFFDRRALLPSGVMFLICCAFSSVQTYIALHAIDVGVKEVYYYFIIYAVVNFISRPTVGRLIDRIGFFVPLLLSCVSIIMTLTIVSFSTNLWMFCFAGIFAGLGMGTSMGALQTMSVAAVEPHRRGVATSSFLIAVDGGYAVGSVIAGAIATTVGYPNMYLISTILPAIAFMIFIFIGKRKIDKYR